MVSSTNNEIIIIIRNDNFANDQHVTIDFTDRLFFFYFHFRNSNDTIVLINEVVGILPYYLSNGDKIELRILFHRNDLNYFC